ncbi:hypothetical protein BHE74_00053766 [Ensete ventricosum]|nr:hypothetical protein BHE74_00053766 [Ensete ventricosum]
MVSQKNSTVIYFARIACRVEFRSVFRAPSQKFKRLAIPNILAHGKSYEHGFTKKHDGHKHCVKLRAESSFDRFFMHRLRNSKYWPISIVEFRSIFLAPSRKLKIMAIPDVLAHGRSYEHGFGKKRDGQKLYAKSRAESSFDWFFMHRHGN